MSKAKPGPGISICLIYICTVDLRSFPRQHTKKVPHQLANVGAVHRDHRTVVVSLPCCETSHVSGMDGNTHKMPSLGRSHSICVTHWENFEDMDVTKPPGQGLDVLGYSYCTTVRVLKHDDIRLLVGHLISSELVGQTESFLYSTERSINWRLLTERFHRLQYTFN